MPKLTDTIIRNAKPRTDRYEIGDDSTPGLKLVVTPTGQLGWAFRYRFAGQLHRLGLGTYPATTLKAARRTAHRYRGLLQQDPPVDPGVAKAAAKDAAKEAADNTVGEVVARYIAQYAVPKTRRTSSGQTARILTKELMVWAKRPITSITKKDVNKILDGINARGHPSASNRCRAAVSHFFKWCLTKDLITASPMIGLGTPNKLVSRDRVLDDNELHRIWNAANRVDPRIGGFVKMLMLTGQRRSEVAGLEWSEIDTDAALWALPKAKAKNHREHLTPLSATALEVLATLPHIAAPGGTLRYAFTVTSRGPVTSFGQWKAILDAAIAEDGEGEMKPWRYHDIRRTFATNWQKLAIRQEVTERALNHVSGKVSGVAAIYGRHDFLNERRAAMAAWEGRLLAIVEGRAAPTSNVVLHPRWSDSTMSHAR